LAAYLLDNMSACLRDSETKNQRISVILRCTSAHKRVSHRASRIAHCASARRRLAWCMNASCIAHQRVLHRASARLASRVRASTRLDLSISASDLVHHASNIAHQHVMRCVTAHCAQHVAHGALRIAHGAWRMAHGAWCMVHGVWRMAYGAWCMAYGAWRMAHGAWRMASRVSVSGDTQQCARRHRS